MNKFNFIENRCWIVMFVLCLVFLFLVLNAYRFLQPEEQVPGDIDKLKSVQTDHAADFNRFINEKNSQEAENDGKYNTSENNNGISENIDEPDFNNINSTNTVSEAIPEKNKAEKLLSEGKYESAVYEYQKMAQIAVSNEDKADCLEKISGIYCSIKRYHTAIPYAKNAYETAPTIERKSELASIYEKLGDFEKAEYYRNAEIKTDIAQEKPQQQEKEENQSQEQNQPPITLLEDID